MLHKCDTVFSNKLIGFLHNLIHELKLSCYIQPSFSSQLRQITRPACMRWSRVVLHVNILWIQILPFIHFNTQTTYYSMTIIPHQTHGYSYFPTVSCQDFIDFLHEECPDTNAELIPLHSDIRNRTINNCVYCQGQTLGYSVRDTK